MSILSNPSVKRALFVILGITLVLFTLRHLQDASNSASPPDIAYSDFVRLVESGAVSSVEIIPSSGMIVATIAPSPSIRTTPPIVEDASGVAATSPIDQPDALVGETTDTQAPLPAAIVDSSPRDILTAAGATAGSITTFVPPAAIEGVLELFKTASPDTTIKVLPPSPPSRWGQVALYALLLLPILILGAIYLSSRKAQQSGGMPGAAASFGKSKSSIVDPDANKVRLSDVAGCDEAKLEVAEIVSFLKNPEDFERVGAKAPRGILMVGPPGTGKTLLAKAIAGEAGVPFFTAVGSDFVEMFVGVGASRVRDLFDKVKQVAPAIVFIDEIDSVGRARAGSNSPGSNDEREQTLNQLLTEMDGFDENSGVVVIAATNRADVLDPALRRPGRFDREVNVSLPDRDGRVQILTLHAAKVPVSNDVSWEKVARGTPGFSGADLANLVNEAALHAARRKASMITPRDLEEARDKILMGVERKGALMNERDRRVVAYHEAGHALVGRFIEHTDPVHKISIVPRGRSLGVTMSLPDEDSFNHNADKLRAEIAMLMGGRAAEDVALSTATVGASNDFHRATALARRMVGVWGMSPLGQISVHGEQGENPWNPSGWSEGWKRQVDDMSAEILRVEYERAKQVMRDHRAELERVALALLEHETLDSEQFEALVAPLKPVVELPPASDDI